MYFVICYLLIYFIEAAIFIIYCKNNLKSRFSSRKYEFLLISLGYLLIFTCSLLKIIIVNCVMFLLINFLLLYYLYDTKILSSLFHASLLTALMGMCEIIVDSALLHFTYDFYSKISIANILIFTAISKLLYFISILIISKLLSFKQKKTLENATKVNAEETFLIIITIFSAFIMFTFAMIIYKLKPTAHISILISLSSFLVLTSDICIFGFYKYSKISQQHFYELQLQLQKESYITKYNEMLLSQHKNQRILIHDIKQHLSTISYLNKNNEVEKIDNYISCITNSSNLKENIILGGSNLLNAIISRYLDTAAELNISFSTDIRSLNINQLSEANITSLFCNLLDNSVEAASKMDNSFIELTISDKRNSPLTTINVVNSCNSSPFSKKTGKLITQKPDPFEHGIGLISIRKIVDYYSGEMDMYYKEEDHTFHTIIVLPKM